MEQLAPGDGFFSTPAAFRLRGGLDADALDRALYEIAKRHTILRTTFPAPDGLPLQRVTAGASRPLSRVDLSGLGDPPGRAAAEAGRMASAPFDLAAGPAWRAVLYRLGEDDHVLLLVLHHIVSDAASIEIIGRELAVLYPAIQADVAHPLAPLPVQYLDFTIWQLERLDGQVRQRLGEWWQHELAGAPHSLAWPTEFRRPAERESAGRFHRRPLPSALSADMRAFARAEQTTPFVVWLSVYAALLSRYCRQPDLLIGVPASTRDRSELSGLIGCFLNMLVVRSDLRSRPTTRQLVRQLHDRIAAAHERRDLPFEELVKQLQPARSPQHTPVFQAGFSFYEAPSPALSLPGLRIEEFDIENERSPYDLMVGVEAAPSGDAGLWAYNDDVLDEATVAGLAAEFEELARQMLRAPDSPVSGLPLLDDETAAVLTRQQPVAPRPAIGVLDLFRERALERPHATALSCDACNLTYGELADRVDELAARLAVLGVQRETPVPVLVERGCDQVVALLAVLRAGGSYVPVDVLQPGARIAAILRDLAVTVIVCGRAALAAHQEMLAAAFPGLTLVMADQPSVPAGNRPPPWPAFLTKSLAYTIYTSGSSGAPKGVEVTHEGLASLLTAIGKVIGITRDDSLLAVTTIAFDIAALEVFLPLITGGRLVLATEQDVADGSRLRQLLADQSVSVLQGTPATWQLVSLAEPLPNPRMTALVGGEALPGALAAQLAGQSTLWNVYGPTEATIWSTAFQVPPASEYPYGVPIGRPLPNTTAHILDEYGQPVPVGFPGEICLGGMGIARGYRGQAARTAASFIPDPFATVPGSRMYRTGDLGRQLPDGTIAFIGRIDDQIKIRGFRIEPGDVEHALLAQPDVREAAVTSWPGPSGAMLVGYYVPGDHPAAATLRDRLLRVLPAYLVPDILVPLDSLPRSHAGKVDRKRLPPPQPGRPVADDKPSPGAETLIAEMWAEVLGTHQISAASSFFDLGGHSLSVAQLRSRLVRTFGVDVPLIDLMRDVTVRAQAKLIETLITEQVAAMTEEEVTALLRNAVDDEADA